MENNKSKEMENNKSIEYNGVKYNLEFNLNVMKNIQEEYGTIEKWGSLTDGKDGEVNIKALMFGLTEAINEGIDIENETAEVKKEFLTEKQVGRIITKLGVENVSKQLNTVVIDSTQNDEKNA